MNRKDIKANLLAIALTATAAIGLSACSTGTDPGETNTERSDIERTEEKESGYSQSSDTANLEDKYYEGREGTTIGDSAYNQDGKRDKRP
ncbi:hypothetical protein [Pontibacter vulgaris]|uniref:hypothetical protein n=1 Tax=Pontibacter vulgaris TaxID=2905679 RepID=UPI001FA7FDAA|nr:hypothetical protein [Pontibacter vulgaris]